MYFLFNGIPCVLDEYILQYVYAYDWNNFFRLTAVAVFATIIARWTIAIVKQIRLCLPPGPYGLPFIGCLPWLYRGSPHSWYLAWAKRYGNIFSLRLGNSLVVCISSANILRDVFNKSDSIGRPKTPLNNLLGGYGIILSEGILWKKQRQFVLDKFRALGVRLWSRQKFENCIIDEVQEMVTEIAVKEEQPQDPVMVLGRHIHNVICQLMMSYRFVDGDPQFQAFNALVTRGMQLFGSVHIGEHLPIYMRLPGKKAVLKEIKANLDKISSFHEAHLISRIEMRKNSSMDYTPEDLLDYYLQEMYKGVEGGELQTVLEDKEKVKQAVQVMNDLFSAGMETSRTAVVWLLLMMIREREVAAKVRQEMSGAVEPGQLVTLDHRLQMPYMEAVIFETLRITCIVPLGTAHVNTSDWNVEGFTIPAGTTLVPLINKINMDPEHFPVPEKFIPERFLENNRLSLPDHFIPFGVGRRICLGEQLARMELFIFFSNLMNNFDWEIPEGDEVPGLEGTYGTIHMPLPFKVIFKKWP
ncbi:cytochrome P450 18a1-like [Pieris napi]|uniref:cytochrome P450 18a1-like n=1 Tax=Pieris napi TaxID=78633 RepID=UPI001FBA9DFD|nr:cytochrome P450 18a1-like [Pieris napi]